MRASDSPSKLETRHLTAVHQGSLWVLALCVLLSSDAAAQKTDVVVLWNGDRITGEIKDLDRGRLRYSTDNMGTPYIEWNKVARITSQNFFEVETRTGTRYYGRFDEPSEDGQVVVGLLDSHSLDIADVVTITRIKSTFWARLSGYVDLGFSFTRARRIVQWSASSEVRYRGRIWGGNLSGNTFFQTQDDVEHPTSRNSAGLSVSRYFSGGWSFDAASQYQQNSELQLDYRTTGGLGPSWRLLRSSTAEVRLLGAAVINRERFTGSDTTSYSLEALVGGEFVAFRYDRPKLDVTTYLLNYVSVTGLGRIRADFELRATYEVLKDFHVGLKFFNNFDSRPQSETAAKNDYGFTITVGYSF